MVATPYKPEDGFELFLWAQRACVPCGNFTEITGVPGYKDCSLGILRRASSLPIDHQNYPPEWTLEDGKPQCSQRVKEIR